MRKLTEINSNLKRIRTTLDEKKESNWGIKFACKIYLLSWKIINFFLI